MEHKNHKSEGMEGKKNHKINSEMKMAKGMPMMDMDEEMGNMKGMCKMVAGKD